MTFNDIYTQVCRRLWGATQPPTIAATMLQGTDGIISEMHRRVQREYNYWFMQKYATISTISGQQSYTLPSDYKQMIEAVWSIDGEQYFSKPLAPVGLRQAQNYLWQTDSELEYPDFYEIANNAIILYPKPKESNRDLHIVYWGYLGKEVTDQTWDGYEDELTIFGSDVLVNGSVVEVADTLKEYDTSRRYTEKLDRDVAILKNEDKARRQMQISEISYRGY